MNISGVLVQVRPQCAAKVRSLIEQLPGVEVHAIASDGRMAVTVEGDTDQQAVHAIEQINRLDNVYATSLVYHHCEAIDDELPDTKEIQLCK